MPNEEQHLNTDELIAAMQAHEHEGAIKLSPREWGKLRGISPQLVYYHIREGHIEKETCICGRSVVDVDLTDKYFKVGQYAEENNLNLKEEGTD